MIHAVYLCVSDRLEQTAVNAWLTRGVEMGKTLENCLPATTQQCHIVEYSRVVPTPLNQHSEQYIRTNETYTERRAM